MSKLSRTIRRLPFIPDAKPTVALVRLEGVIASGARPGRGLSAAGCDKALRKAFASSPAGVVIAVNSPGGAPAQSRMIHDRIRGLAVKREVPVLAYAEDVAASGGYMIALAGDEIVADPFAIIGSVGVISASFGFTEAADKLGVERRVHAAGENKSQLDPFKPEAPEDVARLEDLLTKTHTLFKAMVRDRRGALTSDDLLDGRYWLAGDALAHGLIDEVGDLRTILRARFGDDVRIKSFGVKESGLVGRLLSGQSLSGKANLDAEAVLSAIDARGLWARFGL